MKVPHGSASFLDSFFSLPVGVSLPPRVEFSLLVKYTEHPRACWERKRRSCLSLAPPPPIRRSRAQSPLGPHHSNIQLCDARISRQRYIYPSPTGRLSWIIFAVETSFNTHPRPVALPTPDAVNTGPLSWRCLCLSPQDSSNSPPTCAILSIRPAP